MGQWAVEKVSRDSIPLISPDGSTVLVRDYDKNSMMKAFDMKTGEQQWTVEKVSSDSIPLISPNGSTVLVSDYDKNSMMKAFDMKTGEQQWIVEKVGRDDREHLRAVISPDSS